jgi:ElaB/YqjD/DUF883 family membrane-anchored ribosome-binding protein
MSPATVDTQVLKSFAAEAVDDGVKAARRAIKSVKRGVEEVEDYKDEAVHRIRRRPLAAVGIAAGVSFVAGMALGWVGGRFGGRHAPCREQG